MRKYIFVLCLVAQPVCAMKLYLGTMQLVEFREQRIEKHKEETEKQIEEKICSLWERMGDMMFWTDPEARAVEEEEQEIRNRLLREHEEYARSERSKKLPLIQMPLGFLF